jgi:hypothetical protein
MPKPCYPKVCVLMSHPLKAKWFSFTPSCRFLWWMFTRARVCFPFNRRSFRDCASMTLFMCKSKGKHLVISLSYYTNILFIMAHFLTTLHVRLGLPNPIMAHLSWSQCGHTIDNLSTHLLWWPNGNEHIIAHNTFQDIVAIIVLESGAHVQGEVSHLFLHHT